MRDDVWLLSRLDHLWSNYFSDVEQVNRVFIKFGRFSRFRLGSIKLDHRTNNSHISITSMFQDESIPEAVVDHTIAHELSHYAHGFSSPLKRAHKHPHRGGVVRREMAERGLEHLYDAYQDWLKDYRVQLQESYIPRGYKRKRRRATRVVSVPIFYLPFQTKPRRR
jgi:hypothetical protein